MGRSKGSKIEARFVKLFEGNLTLETFGQNLLIPLQTLSLSSQALAKQLSTETATEIKRFLSGGICREGLYRQISSVQMPIPSL